MRQRPVSTVSVGLVLTLGGMAAAPARAATAWLPQSSSVSAAGANSSEHVVEMASDGTLFAAWETSSRRSILLRPPGGPPGFATGIDAANDLAIGADDAGNLTAVYKSTGGTQLFAATRPAGGVFGDPVPLAGNTADPVDDFRLAVARSGAVVVAWSRQLSGGARVFRSVRPVGGDFSVQQQISDTPASSLAVGIGGTRALVAWSAAGSLVTRPLGADGSVEPAETLSAAAGSDIDIGVDEQGRGVFVWDNSTAIVARRRAANGVYGAEHPLSGPTESPVSPDMAMDDTGDALVVWRGSDGTNDRIRVRRVTAADTLGTTQTLSRADKDADYPQIDAGAGRAAVVWENTTNEDIESALLQPGAAAFDPLLVVGAAPGFANSFPHVAIDGKGNGAAVWAFTDGALYSRIRLAGLDGAGPVITGVTSSATAFTGQVVPFAAAASDVWSGATLAWAFGDGAVAPGASAEHAYATAGRRTVTVTATDALGNATEATRPIDVLAAGGSTPLPDTQAPKLTLTGAARQRLARTRTVLVTAVCDEPCILSATARLTVRGLRKGRALAATVRMATPGKPASLRLRLSRAQGARVRKALKAGKKATVRVVVKATDAAGNAATARRTVRARA